MSSYKRQSENAFSSADIYASAPTSPVEVEVELNDQRKDYNFPSSASAMYQSPFESYKDISAQSRHSQENFGEAQKMSSMNFHSAADLHHQLTNDAASMYKNSYPNMHDASSRYNSNTAESPFRSPYEEYAPTPKSSKAPKMNNARKSLLGPDAFGFDAQNGDPRVIMGEKGNDRNLPHQPTFASTNKRKTQAEEDGAHIELITVPGLGAEYTEEEMQGMRKSARKANRTQRMKNCCISIFKSNNNTLLRDEDGQKTLIGRIQPRVAVFVAFGFCICLGVLLYFVIPRVPMFAVQSRSPLTAIPDGSSMITHHSPTNFSMDMKVNLRADNTANWLATKISKMEMDVTDLSTFKKVGQGIETDLSFPARQKTVFPFSAHFAYASINVTGDQTWSHWINACGPKCKY